MQGGGKKGKAEFITGRYAGWPRIKREDRDPPGSAEEKRGNK